MKSKYAKRFFIVATLLFATMTIYAKSLTINEAENIAKEFLSSKIDKDANSMKRMPTSTMSLSLAYEAKQQDGKSNLFIFNQEDDRFVVVAGDDCISPILGYSDSGMFDLDNAPSNFLYWLESCNIYIDQVRQGKIEHENITIAKSQQNSYASAVAPLLGDIAFHQNKPFNNQCPIVEDGQSIVGCSAVAMGQIMTYYQWPKSGEGSHSYTLNSGQTVSANFNTTYDWNYILHFYQYNYTQQQSNEVAKLLYHCGVSIEMQYGVNGSSSYPNDIIPALIQYFSYDKGMQIYHKNMYNFNDWKNIIKEELNNDRPIIYSGYSKNGGGHTFNCDGYDSNDNFHINWGWGGHCNGYFNLLCLDYEENTNTAYNYDHSIIAHIKPNKKDGTETTEQPFNLVLTSGMRIDDNNLLTLGIRNRGIGTFTGSIAIGIYYNDILQKTLNIWSEIELPYGWGNDSIKTNIGKYEIADKSVVQAIYKELGSEEWKPIAAIVGASDKWQLVDGIWQSISATETKLQIDSITPIGKLTSSKAPTFKVSVSNVGLSDYYGPILLRLVNNDLSVDIRVEEYVSILQNEHHEITFQFQDILTNGEYSVIAYYDHQNGSYSAIYDNSGVYQFPITIGGPLIKMLTIVETNGSSFYPKDEITATFSIHNEQSEGYVYLGMALSGDNGVWYPTIGDNMTSVFLAEKETKQISLSIIVPEDCAAGNYILAIYEDKNDTYYFINPTTNSTKNITINEADNKYGLTVTSATNGGETVGTGRYDYGSEVTIAAIPDFGYKFYRWSDNNKENPRIITVNGNTEYSAEFRAITIELKAQPNDAAFEFVQWSDGVTDNPRIISIADEDIFEYTAIFRMNHTAVDNAHITTAHIYIDVNNNTLYVVGASNDYSVFSETGQLIYSGKDSSIQLPNGVYLVRFGNEVQKIIL